MATTRVQPADARSIFTGEHAMTPVDGKSSSLGRKAGSATREVGLMEFRFQPDLFERVTLALAPISIRICCFAAANCWAGPRRRRINEPTRVRKGDFYPRALWQTHPRPEPVGRDARQYHAWRAWYWQRRPMRGGSREP
jgi:hypothetical protein